MRLILLSVLFALAFSVAQAKFFLFDLFNREENFNFEKLPNHKNFTLMSRFIVHNVGKTTVRYKKNDIVAGPKVADVVIKFRQISTTQVVRNAPHGFQVKKALLDYDWTAVAYRSFEKDTLNLSLSTIFSTGDGPLSNGTGVPYFYLTEAEPAVKGLMRNDSRCGLMMSLTQTKICAENKWDTEDPRCARVFLSGKIQRLAEKTPEYEFAKKTFEARHPLFVGMPGNHNFFYAKYVIEGVKLISGTGGVRVVSVQDYFSVKDSAFNLVPYTF